MIPPEQNPNNIPKNIKETSQELHSKLKSFFETNPLAIEASKSIKSGRKISLILLDSNNPDNENTSYIFTKENGKNVLNTQDKTQPEQADLTFRIPAAVALQLVTKPFENVGQVGLFLFGKIASQESSEKIHFKLHVGFLSLLTGGYLGVLASGGSEVAKYLSSKGLGNLSKLKDTISKMKG